MHYLLQNKNKIEEIYISKADGKTDPYWKTRPNEKSSNPVVLVKFKTVRRVDDALIETFDHCMNNDCSDRHTDWMLKSKGYGETVNAPCFHSKHGDGMMGTSINLACQKIIDKADIGDLKVIDAFETNNMKRERSDLVLVKDDHGNKYIIMINKDTVTGFDQVGENEKISSVLDVVFQYMMSSNSAV